MEKTRKVYMDQTVTLKPTGRKQLVMESHEKEEEKMREFDTGATRDSDDGKTDYEGYLSPYVLRRYGEYMNRHRIQADGKYRDSDNWQKGIPLSAYMKSLWRHLVDLWSLHRQGFSKGELGQDSLCAIIFNASGYLHEILKSKDKTPRIFVSTPKGDPNPYWEAYDKARDAHVKEIKEVGEDIEEKIWGPGMNPPEPGQIYKEKT